MSAGKSQIDYNRRAYRRRLARADVKQAAYTEVDEATVVAKSSDGEVWVWVDGSGWFRCVPELGLPTSSWWG